MSKRTSTPRVTKPSEAARDTLAKLQSGEPPVEQKAAEPVKAPKAKAAQKATPKPKAKTPPKPKAAPKPKDKPAEPALWTVRQTLDWAYGLLPKADDEVTITLTRLQARKTMASLAAYADYAPDFGTKRLNDVHDAAVYSAFHRVYDVVEPLLEGEERDGGVPTPLKPVEAEAEPVVTEPAKPKADANISA